MREFKLSQFKVLDSGMLTFNDGSYNILCEPKVQRGGGEFWQIELKMGEKTMKLYSSSIRYIPQEIIRTLIEEENML